MPNGDPIYYHVHKILEALDLDREDYPDEKIIRELEHILIHLLLTEGPVARITGTVYRNLNCLLKARGLEGKSLVLRILGA